MYGIKTKGTMLLIASAMLLSLLGVGVVSASPSGDISSPMPTVISNTSVGNTLSYTISVTMASLPDHAILLYLSNNNITTTYYGYTNNNGTAVFYLTGIKGTQATTASDFFPATPYSKSADISFANAILTDPPALSGIITNTNLYLGNNINGSIYLNIPTVDMTVPYINGSNFVQDTYCGYFIGVKNSTTPLYESNVILTTGNNYSTTFNYPSANVGNYIVGGVCETTNATYTNGKWAAWSTPITSSNSSANITVVYQPSTSPPPPPLISSINSFFSTITKWIEGILSKL